MKTIFTLILLGCFFAACEDELEVLPENSLTMANALTTPQDFESALNGVEQALKEASSMDNLTQEQKGEYADEIASYIVTDGLLNNYNSVEIRNYNMENWRFWYDGIHMANAVLIDVGAMVLPRTYYDAKARNKDAGAETFFRELSGTFINSLTMNDPITVLFDSVKSHVMFPSTPVHVCITFSVTNDGRLLFEQ